MKKKIILYTLKGRRKNEKERNNVTKQMKLWVVLYVENLSRMMLQMNYYLLMHIIDRNQDYVMEQRDQVLVIIMVDH